MRVAAVRREPTAWNNAGIRLVADDGRTIVTLLPKGAGYLNLTAAEQESVVDALLAAIGDQELEIADRPDEYADRMPDWMAAAGGGRAAGGAVAPGEVRIPAGLEVPRDADGVVIVPARQKVETPEQKRVRRALRKIRNAERDAKAAGSRGVMA